MIPDVSRPLNTEQDRLEATSRKCRIYFQISNALFCQTSKLSIGVATLMNRHLP